MIAKARNARLPLALAALAIVLYVTGELFAPVGLSPDHFVGAAAAAFGHLAVHCGLVTANS